MKYTLESCEEIHGRYTIAKAKLIISAISRELGIEERLILSKHRQTPIMEARHIICVILWKESRMDISATLAASMVNRDHSNSHHSLKTVRNLYKTDMVFRDKYDRCLKAIEHLIIKKTDFIVDQAFINGMISRL